MNSNTVQPTLDSIVDAMRARDSADRFSLGYADAQGMDTDPILESTGGRG